MLPHRLEHTFASIRSSPVKPLIHCGNAFINNTHTLYFPSSLQLSDLEIKKTLLFTSPFIHPATCFKSSIPNLYDSRFQYAQDLKFSLTISSVVSIHLRPNHTSTILNPLHHPKAVSSSYPFMMLRLIHSTKNSFMDYLFGYLMNYVVCTLLTSIVCTLPPLCHSLHYIYLELITKFADVYKFSTL